VPTILSPRLALALLSADKVISKGFPAVSVTFHAPSKELAAKQATTIILMAKTTDRIVLVAFLIMCMVRSLSIIDVPGLSPMAGLGLLMIATQS